MFQDFPTVGVNSTIGSQSVTPGPKEMITGGTTAFKGVTGEMTGVEVGDYWAVSVDYANGFEPAC